MLVYYVVASIAIQECWSCFYLFRQSLVFPKHVLYHGYGRTILLFGYYLSGAYVCSLVLALQMPATNLGEHTKRSTGVALVFFAYCAGKVIGPHAFLLKEAPIYETGCKVMLSCAAAQVALAICLRVLLTRRSKQSDTAAASS